MCRKKKSLKEIDEEAAKTAKPEEEKKEPQMVPLSKYFTYVRGKDRALMIIGTVSAIVAGCLLPAMAIIMGAILNSFGYNDNKDEVLESMRWVCLFTCIVGIGIWIFGYIYYAFWQHLAQNISFDLRSRYLRAVLR